MEEIDFMPKHELRREKSLPSYCCKIFSYRGNQNLSFFKTVFKTVIFGPSANEYEPSNEDIYQLREWIAKVPYIVQDYDDKLLEAVIRKCKGSLQKTKAILENINSLGIRYPEFFGHFDVFNKITQEHLDCVHYFVAPERMEDGTIIIILKLDFENIDFYKFHLYEAQRFLLMCFYVLVWENLYGSGKVIVIFDWRKVHPLHTRDATPVYLKKSAEIRGDNYPFRIVAFHHLNLPPLLEGIKNVLHSFMKKKLLERSHFHKSLESLHGSVPAKLLPKDYGGHLESCAILYDQWRKKIESYRDKLVAESDKMRSLDSLRPKTNDPLDIVGTFRALKCD